MNDILKWALKICLQGVLWVFLLSITINGRALFVHANELLVQNALVQTVDEELADLWYRLSKTAKMTFANPASDEEHAL